MAERQKPSIQTSIQKRKIGQPTKCTPETTEKICAVLRAGNYREAAARFAGIDYSTFCDWINWGREGKEPYSEFAKSVNKAEIDSEVALVAAWKSNVPTNWTAAAALLERRVPERWARRNADHSLHVKRLEAEIELLKAKTKLLESGEASDGKLEIVMRNLGESK